MADHNELGKKGEEIAASHLAKNGYFILDRNYTWIKAELDIIACKGNKLVIAEVKTRRSPYHADPDDTVGRKKLNQIYSATDHYMEIKHIPWEVRYDLITVIIHDDNTWTINHIEEAFYPFMNG